MIAHPTATGWEIIYHRAHALLAAQIAARWGRESRPARLVETIAAISHHDDLEREWGGATQVTFDSDEELTAALQAAPVRTLAWVLSE